MEKSCRKSIIKNVIWQLDITELLSWTGSSSYKRRHRHRNPKRSPGDCTQARTRRPSCFSAKAGVLWHPQDPQASPDLRSTSWQAPPFEKLDTEAELSEGKWESWCSERKFTFIVIRWWTKLVILVLVTTCVWRKTLKLKARSYRKMCGTRQTLYSIASIEAKTISFFSQTSARPDSTFQKLKRHFEWSLRGWSKMTFFLKKQS